MKVTTITADLWTFCIDFCDEHILTVANREQAGPVSALSARKARRQGER